MSIRYVNKQLLFYCSELNTSFFFLGFSKASNLIEQYSNTSYVEKDESDGDLTCPKSKIPKISVENCSNININITFKCD